MEQLMTIEELSNYLQVPKATIYSWRYDGTAPPAVKLGRHLRWKPEDFEAWLVERTSTGSGCLP